MHILCDCQFSISSQILLKLLDDTYCTLFVLVNIRLNVVTLFALHRKGVKVPRAKSGFRFSSSSLPRKMESITQSVSYECQRARENSSFWPDLPSFHHCFIFYFFLGWCSARLLRTIFFFYKIYIILIIYIIYYWLDLKETYYSFHCEIFRFF